MAIEDSIERERSEVARGGRVIDIMVIKIQLQSRHGVQNGLLIHPPLSISPYCFIWRIGERALHGLVAFRHKWCIKRRGLHRMEEATVDKEFADSTIELNNDGPKCTCKMRNSLVTVNAGLGTLKAQASGHSVT